MTGADAIVRPEHVPGTRPEPCVANHVTVSGSRSAERVASGGDRARRWRSARPARAGRPRRRRTRPGATRMPRSASRPRCPAVARPRGAHRYSPASESSTPKPGRGQRGGSTLAAGAVPLRCAATCSSSPSAATIAACTGAGTIIPACLRISSRSRDQRGVAGDERRPVAGQVRLLATASTRRAGPRGCRRRRAGRGRSGTAGPRRPSRQLGVALVARRRRRRASRAQATTFAQVLDAEHLPGGVARRVHPDQPHASRRGPSAATSSVGDRRGAGQRGRPRRTWGRRPRGARRRRPGPSPSSAAARPPAPWSRSSAARRRGRGPGTPRRRANQSATASRSAGVPAGLRVARGVGRGRAARRWTTSGVGSTGRADRQVDDARPGAPAPSP